MIIKPIKYLGPDRNDEMESCWDARVTDGAAVMTNGSSIHNLAPMMGNAYF